MPLPKEESNISCSIFRKREPIIKVFTDMLNKTKDYQHKIEFASDLLRNLDILLDCSEYNVQSFDCKNCRFISNLRKKAANLVIKTKVLVLKGG